MLNYEGDAKATRHIPSEVTRELWVLAGGRCQFRGCNELLYKSPVTQERVNRAQKAHIYSFSPDGPRGRGPYAKKTKGLNSTKNLLLVCHGCHQTIDRDKLGKKYSAELLLSWKADHEARIMLVTGVAPKRRSHVVFYRSRIGEHDAHIDTDDAFSALFPIWHPADDKPIDLSMTCEHEDNKRSFWENETAHLRAIFERKVAQLAADGHATHFSVFAFGDIPLLVFLGSLFTSQKAVETYQLKKEPQTWHRRDDAPRGFRFMLNRPQNSRGEPALVLSCSGRVDHAGLGAKLQREFAVWELTVSEPHNDFLRTREQLSQFRRAARAAIEQIRQTHGRIPLHIFPAVPVSCAVELGRVRMPKLDAPWKLYDYNQKLQGFTYALTIGENP